MTSATDPDQVLRSIRHVPLSYSNEDSRPSALRLVLALRPEWQHGEGEIKFERFKDGITNTLLKATKEAPGLSRQEIDTEAILLRAYGRGTEILIDRKRETISHQLLAEHGLAPPLLARFHNGLLYKYIQGTVCSSADLRRPEIYRGVARKLAEWHALLPITGTANHVAEVCDDSHVRLPINGNELHQAPSGKPAPNVWTVMRKWISALPNTSNAERSRQATLQRELDRIVDDFGDSVGLNDRALVFAHCDLLSGNVIIEPSSSATQKENSHSAVKPVAFIDYEYATPAPAAFDIANHFSEWGGFDCDYFVLPTRSQRRDFLRAYCASWYYHLLTSGHAAGRKPTQTGSSEHDIDFLLEEVDRFRGLPGFYWGIWALIQATISQIDFDYASYAEVRLGEYWDWRAEQEGSREERGEEMPLRERRWAQEE